MTRVSNFPEETSPADDDWIPIVDTSSGKSKRVSVANLETAIGGGGGGDGGSGFTYVVSSHAPPSAPEEEDTWYQQNTGKSFVRIGGVWVEFSDAAALVEVEVPDDIDATGTPSSSTFLRGDGAWATPAVSSDAVDVDIADAGALYTATNVEAALAEVKNVADSAAGGGVATTGTPVANDFARFTAGAIVEGRSYAETRGDLGLSVGGSTPPGSPYLYQEWVNTASGRQFYWAGEQWAEVAGTPPAFNPLDYELGAFNGFAEVGQGGFGFSIDPIEGDPAAALSAIGGAPAGHSHRIQWTIVTTSTYTLSPSDEGKVVLVDVAGGGACNITLPSQENEANWQPGIVLGIMPFSAGTVTITPQAEVRVDADTATPFTLVQHGISTLVRMPANNFWNFSGQVGA